MIKQIEVSQQEREYALITDINAIKTERGKRAELELICGRHEIGQRLIQELDFSRDKTYGKNILVRVSKSCGISTDILYKCIQFAKKYKTVEDAEMKAVKDKPLSWRYITHELIPNKEDIKQPEKVREEKEKELDEKLALQDLSKETVIEKHVKLKKNFVEVKQERKDYKGLYEFEKNLRESAEKDRDKWKKKYDFEVKAHKETANGNKKKELNKCRSLRPPYIDIFNEWYHKIKDKTFHFTVKSNGGIDNCIKNNITPQMFKDAMIKLHKHRNEKTFKWEVENLDTSIIYGSFNKIKDYKNISKGEMSEGDDYKKLDAPPEGHDE